MLLHERLRQYLHPTPAARLQIRAQRKLDRGVLIQEKWDYGASDIMTLRPDTWVNQKAMDYMCATALTRAWKGKPYILVDGTDWEKRCAILKAHHVCNGIKTWDNKVNMFIGGGWALHAVVHPVSFGGHWSLILIFHPSMPRHSHPVRRLYCSA